MSTTRIVLNSAGVKEMLHSAGVNADLQTRANKVQVAASAGMDDPTGMAVIDSHDTNRARWIVLTETAEAMRAEALDRRLTAAIDYARD